MPSTGVKSSKATTNIRNNMRHTTGVIVLNYNNAADTIACINSLRAVTEQECSHKIVVVDNCSARECVESIDRYVEAVHKVAANAAKLADWEKKSQKA